jgi:hypothetical protein
LFLLFANVNPEQATRASRRFWSSAISGFKVGKKEDKLGSARRRPAS